jgi:hypothetical protein
MNKLFAFFSPMALELLHFLIIPKAAEAERGGLASTLFASRDCDDHGG